MATLGQTDATTAIQQSFEATPATTITPTEAMTVAKAIPLPPGVTLTDAVEPIPQQTAMTTTKTTKEADETNQENWFGGGFGHGFGGHGGFGPWGGFGGFGRWGGFGGFGPYRFGFACNGINGWAYPLGYWNTVGAGLFGGGCGLGVPFGGLYYC